MGMRREPVATDRRLRHRLAAVDHGPAERWQHSGRVMELTEQAGVLAVRATEEHALDVLVLRAWISSAQREAALRFRADYHYAGMEARVVGSYNPARTSFSPFGGWDERSDAEEAAYQRWRSAMRAMGAANSDVVVTVACHDQMPGLRQAPLLKAGLDRLVKHYRLPDA